jgi:hypothetical protein
MKNKLKQLSFEKSNRYRKTIKFECIDIEDNELNYRMELPEEERKYLRVGISPSDNEIQFVDPSGGPFVEIGLRLVDINRFPKELAKEFANYKITKIESLPNIHITFTEDK